MLIVGLLNDSGELGRVWVGLFLIPPNNGRPERVKTGGIGSIGDGLNNKQRKPNENPENSPKQGKHLGTTTPGPLGALFKVGAYWASIGAMLLRYAAQVWRVIINAWGVPTCFVWTWGNLKSGMIA